MGGLSLAGREPSYSSPRAQWALEVLCNYRASHSPSLSLHFLIWKMVLVTQGSVQTKCDDVHKLRAVLTHSGSCMRAAITLIQLLVLKQSHEVDSITNPISEMRNWKFRRLSNGQIIECLGVGTRVCSKS